LNGYNLAWTRSYKKDREYEFSRSISFWVKRKSGPDKMYVKFITEFPFTNGEDNISMEVTDNGQFKLRHNCLHFQSHMNQTVESGQ